MPVALDLDTYSQQAESFVSAVDREYYLHFSGRQRDYGIEAIYEQHRGLFERGAVEGLREAAAAAEGDERRRRVYLLELAVGGFLGEATKAQTAELARREGGLKIDVGGRTEAFRQAHILEANEPVPEARAAIERSHLEALDRELNPLYVEIVESAHSLAGEIGWDSYRDMYAELKGYDLFELGRQTDAFLEATDRRYPELVDPSLAGQLGHGIDQLRRCDMPRFFRAPQFDELFPDGRLEQVLQSSMAALGIDLREQPQVTVDLEPRPRKSSRAFCAPVRVPAEVYLVMPIGGGREDYATLLHEGGHAEHYANVDPSLRFEFRHLGDNSVTESFAFLFEHLTEEPLWIESALGGERSQAYLEFTRAAKLIFLRRYAAKLSYELELHGGAALSAMPQRYASGLGKAVGVEWPATTYLSDVDEGFYVASYLRAWALETYWRRHLLNEFGERWFEQREAGDFLRSLWREGQRLRADELLEATLGERLDFGVMLDEVL